ncbi:GntP family permease [Elioraea tepidiphila]|uniref:GntP family permease n=1 Tax=Elioraea tepidiphila TaxID=457934 RepID=UPI002FDA7DDA
MTGIIGVVLALGLLIYLAYRGVTVLILAPLMAVLAAGFDGGVPLLATYTQVFMRATGDFIVPFFPLFLLGAVFGKLMDDSGSAEAIARGMVARLGAGRSILAVVLACAVLTYGGVSLFVVAFAVYPVAAALFRQADIPKRLIPATIALGAFTFTMTALPGTPAIQNAIPMPYFGTTPFAAPGLGVIAGLIMLGIGLAWLSFRERQARASGEGYGASADAAATPDKNLRERAQGEGFDLMEIGAHPPPEARALPSFALAVAPVALVVALNLVFTALVIPRLDTSYLAQPEYGATDIASVRGLWAIVLALTIAIVAIAVANRARLPKLTRSLDDGANASVLPIFNTASLVGFGAVVASLGAFETIRDAVLGVGGGNPLISLAVAVNVLAGMTGSASGGMSIALKTLGPTYLELGQAAGIAPELLHRVTTVATGGLDALPHNGAVITLLGICGLTHRQAYGDLFVVAALGPIVSLVVLIALGTLIGTF